MLAAEPEIIRTATAVVQPPPLVTCDAADPRPTHIVLKRTITGSIEQKRRSSAGYKCPNKYSNMAKCNSWLRLVTRGRCRSCHGPCSSATGAHMRPTVTIVSVTVVSASVGSVTIISAAASVAFAQGPPSTSMGDRPDGATSGAAGNAAAPGLGGNVASGNVGGGTVTSGGDVTVLRGIRDNGSGADYRGSGAPAVGATSGAEAEPAAASECNQNAMQICRQQWDYCSDICVAGDAQSQQTCSTGCVNRYNHCRIASDCR
jgi:hypothetical protein